MKQESGIEEEMITRKEHNEIVKLQDERFHNLAEEFKDLGIIKDALIEEIKRLRKQIKDRDSEICDLKYRTKANRSE